MPFIDADEETITETTEAEAEAPPSPKTVTPIGGLKRLTTISIPQQNGHVYIDEQELRRLVRLGLFKKNDPRYIYFAILIDYKDDVLCINLDQFCEKWSVTQSDALKAIAMLGKNGLITLEIQTLELTFIAKQLCLNV